MDAGYSRVLFGSYADYNVHCSRIPYNPLLELLS